LSRLGNKVLTRYPWMELLVAYCIDGEHMGA
jgi:hypothetical protein